MNAPLEKIVFIFFKLKSKILIKIPLETFLKKGQKWRGEGL